MLAHKRVWDFSELKRPKKRHRLLLSLDIVGEDRSFIEKFRNAARKDRYERSILDFLPRPKAKRVCSSVRSEDSSCEDNKLRQSDTQWIGVGHDLKPYVPQHKRSVLSRLLATRMKRNKSLLPPLGESTQRLPHISSVEYSLEMSGRLATKNPQPTATQQAAKVSPARKRQSSVYRSMKLPAVRSKRTKSDLPDVLSLSGWDVEEGNAWPGDLI